MAPGMGRIHHRCRRAGGMELGAGVLSMGAWRCAGGVRRALCEFMTSGIAIVIAGFMFAGLMVLALVSVFRDERIGLEKGKPGRKKRGGTTPAQRRTSRSRKRERDKLLPADATVTFA